MPTARRLLLPALVLLTLALPVATEPAGTNPPADPLGFAAGTPDRALTRAAVSDATPVLLPAPTRPVAAARVSAPSPRPQRPPVAPRVSRARASRASTGEFRPGWQSRRGEAALALISYPWRDLGWTMSFHEARPGLLGLAHEPNRHIYVFVRRNQSIRALAFTIAHEIGHAHDFTLGTGESHARWRELRGIDPEMPWAGCNGCGDLETPAGDFAEVFAVWQVGPVDYRSRLAPLPSGERLRMLSREFTANGTYAAT